MNVRPEILLLLAAMGVVTYGPRWFPILFLSGKRLPPWFRAWLDFIPAAILSALVLPSLVTKGTPRTFLLWSPEMMVALPTFLFALKTRSLGGTVVVGMFLYWAVGIWG